MMKFYSKFIFSVSLSLFANNILAQNAKIAIASNFLSTAKVLVNEFTQKTQQKIVLIVGSTGKHYAQIMYGAPFDAFFAADSLRPELLQKKHKIIEGSRFTYASGKLVLWSPKYQLAGLKDKIFFDNRIKFLAIANPKLAPYGRAAKDVLKRLKIYSKLHRKMVKGENVGQAFQFVKSGHADLGLVAWSQIMQLKTASKNNIWVLPESWYHPITQQAVLLKNNPIAINFIAFVKSDAGKRIIKRFGYAD